MNNKYAGMANCKFIGSGHFSMKKFLIIISLFLVNIAVSAQELTAPFKIIDPEIIDQYKYMYKNTSSGDSFDPSTGSVTFSVTDINLPGNFSIPVQLSRWIPADDLSTGSGIVWQWNLPLIKANYVDRNPYVQANGEIIRTNDGWYAGKNCSESFSQSVAVSNRELSHGVEPTFYWNGKLLHIPGKTTEKFLTGTSESPYFNGKEFTKSNFYVSECVPLTGNQEGFIVKGPDGTAYTFGKVKSYYTGAAPPQLNSPITTFTKVILITEIKDKFGNTVNYQYDGPNGFLSAIVGSDGRRIDLKYKSYIYKGNSIYIPDYVEANGKKWLYEYADYPLEANSVEVRKYLKKVHLPDASFWEYDFAITELAFDPNRSLQAPNYNSVNGENVPGYCGGLVSANPTSMYAPFETTVKTPGGLSTKYSFALTYFGRSDVSPFIQWSGSVERARNMNCNVQFSLRKKELSGPSLNSQIWTYNYSQNKGTYKVECINGSCRDLNGLQSGDSNLYFINGKPSIMVDAKDFRSTTVAGPDSKIVYYIDRNFSSPTEGEVVAEDYLSLSNNSLLKRVERVYEKGHFIGEVWAYAVKSYDLGSVIYASLNKNMINHRVNKLKEKITLYSIDGNSVYTTDYSNYDVFGVAEKTSEYNDFSSYRRYTKQIYSNDTTSWMLGFPTIKSISSNDASYVPTEEIVYHSSANTNLYTGFYLPYEYKSYGTWLRRYPEYYADGTLKRIEYNQQLRNAAGSLVSGKNRYQVLSSYKRGKAQTILTSQRYSDTATMSFSRTINDDGWITSITDLNGITASYGYDQVGRLKSVDLPSGWLDTSIEWQEIANYPTKRIARSCTLTSDLSSCVAGTATIESTAEFDALYRVTKTDDYDLVVTTHRYQNYSFDSKHLPTFTSHKSTSIAETAGTTNTYDNIGRLKTSSLSYGGSVSYEYLAGNKIRVTDAKNNQTTTTYLAYGAPEYSQMLNVVSPENVTTSQAINIFGNVTSITQTGPGKNGVGTSSLTEYRAYDTQHNLCKISRNDVGTTVFSNNPLGEVQWQAQGVGGGTVDDCNSNAGADKQIQFVYDNLGNKWKVDYPNVPTNPASDLTYTLDNNGNIKTLVSGAVTQTYNYNILGLLEDERLQVNGKSFLLDYGYNGAGHLSSLTYPDGDKVDFNPNAFGEARQAIRQARPGGGAFTYANQATYYPTGQVNTFNYGNGLIHKTTLNTRMLPESVQDYRSGLKALHYDYIYDNNLKVASITDNVNTSYSITSLTYDGLGRLSGTVGNSGIGSSQMKYDGLGNITYYQNKKHTLDYFYDTSNRLQSVASSGAISRPYSAFSYDDRGNVTNNSYNSFDYNRANQMVVSGSNQYTYDGYNRRVVAVEAGKTSYSFYNQSGQLLYSENSDGGINYIFLGKKLIAKDGFVPQNAVKQHYLPFGASIEGEINDVGYTGHKFDKSINLSYMQARYYDPVLGRFYGNDPVGFTGDVSTFNRFSYVGNDPINKTDPTGKWAFLLFAPEIIAATKAILFVGSAATVAAVASDAIDTTGENSGSSDASGFKDIPQNKPPFTGEPGSTVRGGTGSRTYDDDGYPKTDRDLPHPDEAGIGCEDHCHDWSRPEDGSPPTHEDRGLGRAPEVGDPPAPRGPNVPPPDLEKLNQGLK